MTDQPTCQSKDNLIFIGICGKPGAGKDTIGGYIHHEYGFFPMTIKKPIEDAVKAVLQVDDYHLYDRDAREQPLDDWPGWTVRKALQGFAQSLRDLVGEHLWAQSLCMRMDQTPPYSKRVVVTDIRTPGDVAYIKKHIQSKGGRFILWMVKRPGYGATTAGGFSNHKLESYDLEADCDAVFENDGTVETLHAKAGGWLSSRKIYNFEYQNDKRLFEAITAAVENSHRALDPLAQSVRSAYCYCKPGDKHCGICDICKQPGHVRALGPVTSGWCDSCFIKHVNSKDNV